MSILKITCPHCNFSYVLPENKVPSGELTVRCQNCQQTYTYAKPGPNLNLRGHAGKGRLPEPNISTGPNQKTPEVENRPFYREASAPEPATLRDEPEKDRESSNESIPIASGVENRLSPGWEPAGLPEEPGPVQASAENISEAPAVEESRSPGWQPANLPEEPGPVQASAENISEAPAVEESRSLGWQPANLPEEPGPVQASAENISEAPAVEESGFLRSESENREKPKQAQASAESIPKASVAELTPPPVPKPLHKPVKKIIRKPVAGATRGARTKWIIAVAVGCAIAIVISVAVYKPVVVTRVKEMYSIWSVNIKQNISSLVNEKTEPKPTVTAPSQPSIAISRESAIVRPSNFREAAGTWTGQLRSDRKGPKWTFSFNPANYDVSIKNDSGLWIRGTAVYHWDQGIAGDTLRVKPRWNVLDIDVIKSSVGEYAGKASLGAFSRYENDLKLCMSRPGKMIEPTETDTTGDIQCFDLKKKGS